MTPEVSVPAPAVLELYGCAALWPDPAEDPAFGALLAEAKRRLVAHFGDALAVLNGRERYEQLLALPAAGLEALLESDDFGTDSESSVVLLLAEWMAAAHSRTDEATRRRLCGLLRLAQCSRTYLSWVLPALAARHEASPGSAAGWLPVTQADTTCLLVYSTATVQERRAWTGGSAAGFPCAAISDWPASWLSTQPRRQCLPVEGRTLHFSATLAELGKAFGNLKSGESEWLKPGMADCRLTNHIVSYGLVWEHCMAWEYGEAAADIWIRPKLPAALCSVVVAGAAAAAREELLAGAVVAGPDLRLSVCGAGGQLAWSGRLDGALSTRILVGWCWRAVLKLQEKETSAEQPGGAASAPDSSSGVAARWGRYLQGGTRLAGSITLRPPPPP